MRSVLEIGFLEFPVVFPGRVGFVSFFLVVRSHVEAYAFPVLVEVALVATFSGGFANLVMEAPETTLRHLYLLLLA